MTYKRSIRILFHVNKTYIENVVVTKETFIWLIVLVIVLLTFYFSVVLAYIKFN